MVPGDRPVIELVNGPVPVLSVVLLSAVVGSSDVLQHTPLAVTESPPSEVTFPPLDAVVDVMLETEVVVTVGVIALTVKTSLVPFKLPAVAVMVGVSLEFVRKNPDIIATPSVNVWFPSEGLVGAVPPGEFVAVHVQFML